MPSSAYVRHVHLQGRPPMPSFCAHHLLVFSLGLFAQTTISVRYTPPLVGAPKLSF